MLQRGVGDEFIHCEAVIANSLLQRAITHAKLNNQSSYMN